MMTPSEAIRSFDESMYLERNPDVAAAVSSGGFLSAWHHYLSHGSRENRPGVPHGFHPAVQDLLRDVAIEALPPPHLRKRVHGEDALESFEHVGGSVAYNISAAIRSEPRSDSPRRILDFGCGCGRVLKYFSKMTDHAEFHGSDIDPEAIAWCQEHLSHVAGFVVNPPYPPAPFEDNFFDFIYAISVFTHLPEDMEHAWLAELCRITNPGGLVLLTSHGEHLLTPHISGQMLSEFQASGFYYHVEGGTEGLPSFYQTSYHTDDYILNHWSRFFTIEKFIKRGIANYQDLILCRKRVD